MAAVTRIQASVRARNVKAKMRAVIEGVIRWRRVLTLELIELPPLATKTSGWTIREVTSLASRVHVRAYPKPDVDAPPPAADDALPLYAHAAANLSAMIDVLWIRAVSEDEFVRGKKQPMVITKMPFVPQNYYRGP